MVPGTAADGINGVEVSTTNRAARRVFSDVAIGLCRLCNAQGPGGKGAPLRGLYSGISFLLSDTECVVKSTEIYGFLRVLTQQLC